MSTANNVPASISVEAARDKPLHKRKSEDDDHQVKAVDELPSPAKKTKWSQRPSPTLEDKPLAITTKLVTSGPLQAQNAAAGQKRKSDTAKEDSSPKKLAKVEPTSALAQQSRVHTAELDAAPKRSSAVPALRNFHSACYQNASLQVLHQMQEYAGRTSDERRSSLHLESDLIDRAGQKGRGGAKARNDIAARLQRMKNAGTVELSDIFATIMKQMSSGKGPVNPVVFNLACGVFFDCSFDGTEQLDAAEFLERLLPLLEQDHPELHDLRRLEIEQRKKCRDCGTIKELVDNDLVLTIPEDKRKGRQTVSIEDLFRAAISAPADCKDLRCNVCSQTGSWEEVEGWQAARSRQLRIAPRYLAVRVQREDYQVLPNGVWTAVKFQTNIDLACRKLRWRTSGGLKIRYELFAAIEHTGSGTTHGHYTALRKSDERWFNCDDATRTGIKKLTVEELRKHGQVKVCFLRKV